MIVAREEEDKSSNRKLSNTLSSKLSDEFEEKQLCLWMWGEARVDHKWRHARRHRGLMILWPQLKSCTTQKRDMVSKIQKKYVTSFIDDPLNLMFNIMFKVRLLQSYKSAPGKYTGQSHPFTFKKLELLL